MDTCEKVVTYYKNLLDEFDMDMTPELEQKIVNLYPDANAIENLVMPILMMHLEMKD